MTRATSREAYRQLTESGAIKGKQAEILGCVVERGPATAAEVLEGTPHDRNRNLARARFTELQDRGLIIEVGARKCKITGRTALVWEATDRTKPLNSKRGHKHAQRRVRVQRVLEENILGMHPSLTIETLAEKVIAAVRG